MFLKDQLAGLVPVEQAKEIMKMVARGSSILRLSSVQAMNSEKKKFPILTEGPGAYWVGEGARIQTSGATWIYPEIVAKKLAVIVPVTKEKLNDTTIDVFEELKEPIAEAFYKAFDAAALFGTSSPFAKNIIGVAEDAGNLIIRDSSVSLDLDIADVMALIEDGGFDVNGFSAHYGVKNSLRKLRDTAGNQLFVAGVDTNELYANPIEFSRNGAWDKSKADIIAADWSKSLVGIREGIEFEILTEATLQGTLDSDNKPLSLAEQDMIAIKATMRLGFLPIKDDAFAALVPSGATGILDTLTITNAAGSSSTATKITAVTGNTNGGTLKYKVGAGLSAPTYGTSDSGYIELELDEDITCAANDKIVVVEVAHNGRIVATSASTTVTVGS